MKTKIIISAVIVFLSLALMSAVYFWYQERNKPVESKVEYVKVPEIKEVTKIKRVEVPIEKIVTIEKPVIVEKLQLPDWFRTDTNKQAIATATISPYEGKTHAVAVIDTKTGVGEMIVKQEPLSFVGFANDKGLYAKAGYSTNSEMQATIGAEWKFLRVGKIKVGVFGEGRAYFEMGQNKENARQNVEAVGGVSIYF